MDLSNESFFNTYRYIVNNNWNDILCYLKDKKILDMLSNYDQQILLKTLLKYIKNKSIIYHYNIIKIQSIYRGNKCRKILFYSDYLRRTDFPWNKNLQYNKKFIFLLHKICCYNIYKYNNPYPNNLFYHIGHINLIKEYENNN